MRNKKLFFILSSIVLLVIIIITLIVLNFITLSPENNIKQLSNSLRAEGINYKNYVDKTKFESNLKILENPQKNYKDRYKALELNLDSFKTAYGYTNNPKLRNYIISLDPLAKKAFPKEYKESTFEVACADTECGEKMDSKLKIIVNQIAKINAEKPYIDTILLNLNIAAFIPYDTDENKMDKIISYTLAYNQLKSLNNKQASESAQMIKSYVKEKYNQPLYEKTN